MAKPGQLGEGLSQLLGNNLLLVYLQPLAEKPLVEQPPFLRPSQAVGPLDVVGQFQRLVESHEHVIMLNAQMFDPLGRANPLSLNAFLLGSEQRFADLIGVMRRQQLPLLLLKAGKSHFSLGDLLGRQDRGCLDLAFDRRPDALPPLLAQLPGRVVVLNSSLNGGDPMSALGTVAVLLTAADEVFVFAAVAGGFAVDQPTTTVSAINAAAQVVEVSPGPFATNPLARQKVLNL